MDDATILLRRVHEMSAELIRLLPELGIALIVIIATSVVAKFARRIAEMLLRRPELRGTLTNLVETFAGVSIWGLGILIARSVIFPGVTPLSILVVLSLGLVAIGFAFKEIFANFLVGVLIMLRKRIENPFPYRRRIFKGPGPERLGQGKPSQRDLRERVQA